MTSTNDQVQAATVVVCTRNRGDKIVATIASVLDGAPPGLEVLVIDQSDNDETRDALADVIAGGQVRYLRSTEQGVSRSRTLSLHEAHTEFVLNTDDDCIVDANWVRENIRALEANPDAAIVFGDVIAPPGEGYAPESVAERDFVVRSIWRWTVTDGVNVGIGASMAMRRSMLLELGGFDVELGPGSALRNAEDTDMTLRALLAGHTIVRTRQAKVDHYGHRSHDEFRSLTRGAMLGLGAMTGKLIRRRPLAATWFLSSMAWRLVVKVAIVDIAHLRRPPVLGRAVYMAKGFWRGLRKPLQPGSHILFVDGQRRRRITFVTEQQVGLRTYSENLRRFAEGDERIEGTWEPITYAKEGGRLERMTFLPRGLIGSLRGRLQVRHAVRHDADACLFLTQTPVALGGRLARKRPYVIMVDDTPKLLDSMSEHYGMRADKPGPIATVKRRINSIGLRRAHRVLPMSEWARRSLIDDYGVQPDRAVVVATGIDLERWTPDTEPHEGPMRILFVGGDFERKGGAVMLAAFDQLPKGSAELHVVTRSTLDPHDGVIPHYGMQPNSPELITLFKSCDVFVLPSRAEAFPNVVIEASASGLPSIVTAVGAMAEMVVHGETGYVIGVDDSGELARLLQQLADRPDLRSQLGAAARRRAEAHFDGRRNSARVIDHLLAAANEAT